MIEPEVVERKIEDLHEHAKQLHSMRQWSLTELLGDPIKRYAFERAVQLAAQIVIDIAGHLLAGLGISPGEDYRQSIAGLSTAGVLPADFAERLSGLAGSRNILVHEYARIDHALLHAQLQRQWGDFCEFARHVRDFLRRRRPVHAGGAQAPPVALD